MSTESNIPVTERIVQLLEHLGIEQAHFAARSLGDLTGLAADYPDKFTSLTLVCPGLPSSNVVEPLAFKLLVFGGDTDAYDRLGQLMATIPEARFETLNGYENWSDLIACHTAEIEDVMLPFLADRTPETVPTMAFAEGERGAVVGISYQIQGVGPPLVLMPIGLIPTQWDAIMPKLMKNYCTITLGGAELGMTALLEKRATLDGYIGMVRYLVQEAAVQPGESILEVGSGTGALTRWLYNYTKGRNSVKGVDINQYLLREAENIARLEGLDGEIQFDVGNAEALDYPDEAFDFVFSVTVMEEVDADKMLAEMIRVTKPGGRVGVIVRAMDVPFFLNLPLGKALKAKIEDPTLWVNAAARGCADISLYRRFQESDLNNVTMYPFLAPFNSPWIVDFIEGSIMSLLNKSETAEWHSARAQAEVEGTAMFSYPHHCAVGTKPGS